MTIKLLQLNHGHVDHFKARRLATSVFFGGVSKETWFSDSPIGKISASTTAMVLVEPASADQACAILKPDEAREVAQHLMHYAHMASQRQRFINGETVRRVRVDGDLVTVTYSGDTMPMRLQRLTKQRNPNRCSECHAPIVDESWVSVRTTDKGWGPKQRVGEIRICKDCLPKLKVDNQIAPMIVHSKESGPNE